MYKTALRQIILGLLWMHIIIICSAYAADISFLRKTLATKEPAESSSSSSPLIRIHRVSRDNDVLHVEIANPVTNMIEPFTLQLDRDLFAKDATVQLGGEGSSMERLKTTQTFMHVNRITKEWATATVEEDSTTPRISGTFSSSRIGGSFRVDSSSEGKDNRHEIRRLSEVQHPYGDDVTIEAPEFKQRQQQRKQSKKKASSSSNNVLPSNNNNPTETISASVDANNIWSPGCYPGDAAPLSVYISVATDAGFLARVNMNNPDNGTLTGQRAAVLREVEKAVSTVRPYYLSQLNVQLQIRQVIIGLSNDSSQILRRSRMVPGTCTGDPLGTLADFSQWATSQQATAHWHLLTDCFPSGTIGAGYIGGLCSKYGNNVAFSSLTPILWLTMAHEIGHVFGAQHTFFGGNGGIMDYGNGRYNGGDVQFAPQNRADMCGELTYAVNSQCRHVEFAALSSLCGNGVLEPSEQCECVDGSNSCGSGSCVNCMLQDKQRQCTVLSDPFVIRQPLTPPFVAVTDQASLVSHPDCCTNGLLPSPQQRTTCNNGRDVCSATGTCKKACSLFFLPPCAGFDDSGCVQKCLQNSICMGPELKTMGPPPISAGAVPDGLACRISSSALSGTCLKGVCIASTPTPTQIKQVDNDGSSPPTMAPSLASSMTSKPSQSSTTATPTGAPTIRFTTRPSIVPTTATPTRKPTVQPTARPSKFPTTTTPTIRATARPSKSPNTSRPSKSPSTTLISTVPNQLPCPPSQSLVGCPTIRRRDQCTTSSSFSCTWCGPSKGCQASPLLCGSSSRAARKFAHCAPFKSLKIAV